MTDAKRWGRAAEWYAAGLFLVYAVAVFAHAGGPSLTDYANWTYQGVLLREHLLGHADVAHRLKAYPVPNSLTTLGVAAFALVLPWLWAAKLWLAVQLGLCFACMRSLLRTVGAPAVAWVVVPQAVFMNVNFWYGFMNFELGLAWLMLFAALLLRRMRGERVPGWVPALLLVLVFFTHMIPFCFCVLLLALSAWQTGRWRETVAALPAVLLTIWYVAGRFLLAGNADGQAGMSESVRNYSAAFWAFKVNSYLKSFGFANPSGDDRLVLGSAAFFGLLLAEACLAGVVGWGLVRMARGARKRQADWFVWVGLGCLLPGYLLAPGTILGISDPGARLLQTGLALGLALCWPRVRGGLRVLAGVCGVVLAAGGAVMFFLFPAVSVSPFPAVDSFQRSKVGQFARVPNDDQDYFYRALDAGDLRLKVFPTGMLLNQDAETPPTK